jgi:hypothetical protein
MFKWICFATAVGFLGALTWMVNDVRLAVHRSGESVRTTAQTVNEHLPAVVEKTKKTTDTLAEHLPGIVEQTHKVTETVSALTEDIRQLRELLALSQTPRDKNLLAYSKSVLDIIASADGKIGLKKLVGKGLKNDRSAREWADSARTEAAVMTVLGKPKRELVIRLCRNWQGFQWYLQPAGKKEPVRLLDWLKANHPATAEVFKGAEKGE